MEVDLRKVNCLKGDDGALHFDALALISYSVRLIRFRQVGSVLDIFLEFIRMSTSVQKDLFHASVGQEFEGIFDERGIRQRKKTLFP